MYSEVQRFRQWWLVAIITLVAGVTTYYALTHNDEQEIGNTGIVCITFLAPALIITLFLVLKLETHIDDKGISYRFNLFHFKPRFISWDEIILAFVKKYNPIRDYGGWGIRYGWPGTGRAYNVSGNIGLFIVLKDGKSLLIGTSQKDELILALINLKNKYKIESIDTNFHSS